MLPGSQQERISAAALYIYRILAVIHIHTDNTKPSQAMSGTECGNFRSFLIPSEVRVEELVQINMVWLCRLWESMRRFR